MGARERTGTSESQVSEAPGQFSMPRWAGSPTRPQDFRLLMARQLARESAQSPVTSSGELQPSVTAAVDRDLLERPRGSAELVAAGIGAAAAIMIVCDNKAGRGGRRGNRSAASVAGQLRGDGGPGGGMLPPPRDAADVPGDDRGDADGPGAGELLDAGRSSRPRWPAPAPVGQYQMQFFSSANNPGYGKLYVQIINDSGDVVSEYKDTLGPTGLIERKWITGP
jgi:hypothetical protein